MKDLYSVFTNEELWLIRENEWAPSLQNIRESQFALGNGYLGSRGVLEEIPYDAIPGTYIAGIYDKMTSQVSELVNLPNPFNFKFSVKGEKIGLIAMDVLDHRRTLNMNKAVLTRHTLYSDTKKRRYDYQSLRFLSKSDKNIGVIQIALTAVDGSCVVDINTGIDTSVANAGVLTEGRKRHFRARELGQDKGAGYLVVDTFEKKHRIIYWSGFYYEIGAKKIYAPDNVFRLKLKKNQTVVFTKIFCIKHFPYTKDHSRQKKETFKIFNAAFRDSFTNLLKDHIQVWEKLWKRADVVITGTANIQTNLRFNIYHMLACAHCDNGFSSVGARSLSGEGYRGHVFWDTEIFLFPFYLFTFPEVAKNMLLYRFKRLDESRKLARAGGFRGARFAWESADSGEEETPAWARDIDGTVIKIHTHQMEYHITSDIAYALYKYYVATRDEKFIETCGYELFIATARFWASRVRYNRRNKEYEINNVIGPDEFHVDVNNNAFTNMMAKWNLIIAHKMWQKLKHHLPVSRKLKAKLALNDKEARSWKEIASRIRIKINRNNVIEQFEGYFKLKDVTLTKTDENGIPLIPARLRAKDLGKTKLVKQADVMMLLYLLDDVFSLKTKIANHEYYFPKTVHRSSLSAPMHALMACEVDDSRAAYNLFNVALRADISNLYGNSQEGIHAASLGGTWQAVVHGYAGVKIEKEVLSIAPRMPRTWQKIAFSLTWRQYLVELELTNDVVKVKVKGIRRRTTKGLKVKVFGKPVSLRVNKTCSFKRLAAPHKEQYY